MIGLQSHAVQAEENQTKQNITIKQQILVCEDDKLMFITCSPYCFMLWVQILVSTCIL